MSLSLFQCLPARTKCSISFWLILCITSVPALAGIQALNYKQQKLTVEGQNRTVRLPRGYRLEWIAKMDEPRMLTFAANGDLFAGSRSGKVYRLPPPCTRAEACIELGDYPHSVAFRPGEILIARTNWVYRAPYRKGQSRITRDDVSLVQDGKDRRVDTG